MTLTGQRVAGTPGQQKAGQQAKVARQRPGNATRICPALDSLMLNLRIKASTSSQVNAQFQVGRIRALPRFGVPSRIRRDGTPIPAPAFVGGSVRMRNFRPAAGQIDFVLA